MIQEAYIAGEEAALEKLGSTRTSKVLMEALGGPKSDAYKAAISKFKKAHQPHKGPDFVSPQLLPFYAKSKGALNSKKQWDSLSSDHQMGHRYGSNPSIPSDEQQIAYQQVFPDLIMGEARIAKDLMPKLKEIAKGTSMRIKSKMSYLKDKPEMRGKFTTKVMDAEGPLNKYVEKALDNLNESGAVTGPTLSMGLKLR